MVEFSSKFVKVVLPYKGGKGWLQSGGVGKVLTVLPYINITYLKTFIAIKVYCF
jgi:hypothetical protein